MKAITKKILVVAMSAVCLILIVGLILSLVTVKPIDSLGNGGTISVLSAFETTQTTTEEKNKALDEAVGTVKFSIMRSMLELGTNYKIRAVTTTDEDGDTVRASFKASEFKSLRAIGDQFMLRVSFDDVQTNDRFTDADGNKIKYDTIVIFVDKGDNKISDVKLYPYLFDNMNNQSPSNVADENGHMGTEFYKIYEFKAKMYTYKMYNILDDHFTAGTVNSSAQ